MLRKVKRRYSMENTRQTNYRSVMVTSTTLHLLLDRSLDKNITGD